jgi:hypothetical protein
MGGRCIEVKGIGFYEAKGLTFNFTIDVIPEFFSTGRNVNIPRV